jgi:beta-glucosidase-like glycosyl hydrolase
MRSSRLETVVGSVLCLLPAACAEPTVATGTAPGASSAAPSPTPTPEPDPVAEAPADLDRRQQSAQLIVVGDLLREQLGLDGSVISDDIGAAQTMQGVPVDEPEVRYLDAGGTPVLTLDADLVTKTSDAVLARAESDPAFSATVDTAVRTTLTAEGGAGLLPGS